MNKIKICVFCILNSLLGFLSFKFIPLAWLIATNTLKGKVNNPEGEFFVPFGIFLLIIIPIIVILCNMSMYISTKAEKRLVYYIVFLYFVLGLLFAVAT